MVDQLLLRYNVSIFGLRNKEGKSLRRTLSLIVTTVSWTLLKVSTLCVFFSL